jgi:hypothetical protein
MISSRSWKVKVYKHTARALCRFEIIKNRVLIASKRKEEIGKYKRHILNGN